VSTPTQPDPWIAEIREYCRKLNIELDDLHQVLTDLKVSPMIRGKAFEFTVCRELQRILPADEWTVTKPPTGVRDVDVRVVHKMTGRVIRVECKLALKGEFKVAGKKGKNREKGDFLIPVKCMRSRTTKTPEKAESKAKEFGVSTDAFLLHSDSYRVHHFDVIATSIANAFYVTEKDKELDIETYKFKPTAAGEKFIRKLNPPDEDVQTFVYNRIYLARAEDIVASAASGIKCRRTKCRDSDCGFIPNDAQVNFGKVEELPDGVIPRPINKWIEIEQARAFFADFAPEDKSARAEGEGLEARTPSPDGQEVFEWASLRRNLK
jgi:hypothetical protein